MRVAASPSSLFPPLPLFPSHLHHYITYRSKSELAITKTYEIICEIGMSIFALLWLMRHDLNFAAILNDIDHNFLFLGHLSSAIFSSFSVVLIFKSVPVFGFCSELDPCSCSSFYFPLYGSYCEAEAVEKQGERLRGWFRLMNQCLTRAPRYDPLSI